MSNINTINDYNSLTTDLIFTSLAETISNLNTEELKEGLNKRGLIDIGTEPELKTRLLQCLNGESIPSDFIAYEQRDFFPIINTPHIIKNMENKKPFFKPGKFTGNISDSISSFLKKYERAAKINGWTNDEKAQYLVAFLEGPAITFYENLENKNEGTPTWHTLEKAFREEYEPITQIDLLRTVLQKRKQLDDELTVTYINDAESLCRRIDPLMSEQEIVRNIRKGLKPSIARYIGVLENNTINELNENIRKYDRVEFMISGESMQSPTEINTNIIKQQINAINTEKNEQLNKLIESNKQMMKQIQEINTSQNNTNYKNNNNSPYEKYNNPQIQAQTYNNSPQQKYNAPQNPYLPQLNNYNNPHPYNITNQTGYQYQNQNRAYNPIKYKNPTRQTQFPIKQSKCEICNYNNHTTQQCYYKDNPVKCPICNKIGHTSQKCFKNTQYQKN